MRPEGGVGDSGRETQSGPRQEKSWDERGLTWGGKFDTGDKDVGWQTEVPCSEREEGVFWQG